MTFSEVAAALDRIETLVGAWLKAQGPDDDGFWQHLASVADDVVENISGADEWRYFSARLDAILLRHGVPSAPC